MSPAPPSAGPPSSPAPIDCHVAVRRLWDYLDGRLPALSEREVEHHLAACVLCPPHFAFARSMRSALAASAPPRVLPEQEARLRDRVISALRELESDVDRGGESA